MAADDSLAFVTLPATTLDHVSQSTVRDVIQYFTPDLVTIPGPRNPKAYASVRDAAPKVSVVHPQIARGGERVQHYRYAAEVGLRKAPDQAPSDETIDILAVQTRDVLSDLQTQLSTNERQTGHGAATFVIVPHLSVDWDTTSLSTTLPSA